MSTTEITAAEILNGKCISQAPILQYALNRAFSVKVYVEYDRVMIALFTSMKEGHTLNQNGKLYCNDSFHISNLTKEAVHSSLEDLMNILDEIHSNVSMKTFQLMEKVNESTLDYGKIRESSASVMGLPEAEDNLKLLIGDDTVYTDIRDNAVSKVMVDHMKNLMPGIF